MNILDILQVPMGYLLRFAYAITDNYLLSIFLFTLVMEVLLIPLQIKQQKNQIKQASLAPKLAAIRKKYAGRDDQPTKQKMQQETMDMYQKEGFNPAGGCGTLLIQFPIIIALYNVVTNPLRYISNVPNDQIASLVEFFKSTGVELDIRNQQINIINRIRENVSDYISVAPALDGAVLPNFNVGPFDLSQVPEISFSPFNWLMLIPVVTFFVMIASQKIMQKFSYQSPETKDAQESLSMKIMTWSMPLMSVYFEFQLAAAIGVYWTFRSVLQTVERIIISKLMPVPVFTEADYKEAERKMGVQNKPVKKSKDPNRKPVRSLHHIDDEEYLARHANDFAESSDPAPTTDKTEAKNAPAPIKNDETTAYKEKK